MTTWAGMYLEHVPTSYTQAKNEEKLEELKVAMFEEIGGIDGTEEHLNTGLRTDGQEEFSRLKMGVQKNACDERTIHG